MKSRLNLRGETSLQERFAALNKLFGQDISKLGSKRLFAPFLVIKGFFETSGRR